MQARIFLPWPSTLAFTGRKLTFQRRLVMLLAWLTLFPNCGPLPQISQTRAITRTFQLLWIKICWTDLLDIDLVNKDLVYRDLIAATTGKAPQASLAALTSKASANLKRMYLQ